MLRITVPHDVVATLESALRKAGDRECGGVLMGEHVGSNHFVVRRLTVQRPGTIASFVRSLLSATTALKDFFRRTNHQYERFNYLGEWHSHPRWSVEPSSQDHASMRELITDPTVGTNFVVLLIVRLAPHGIEGSAHTYLPDSSIHPSNLVFESTS